MPRTPSRVRVRERCAHGRLKAHMLVAPLTCRAPRLDSSALRRGLSSCQRLRLDSEASSHARGAGLHRRASRGGRAQGLGREALVPLARPGDEVVGGLEGPVPRRAEGLTSGRLGGVSCGPRGSDSSSRPVSWRRAGSVSSGSGQRNPRRRRRSSTRPRSTTRPGATPRRRSSTSRRWRCARSATWRGRTSGMPRCSGEIPRERWPTTRRPPSSTPMTTGSTTSRAARWRGWAG